ncbi:uncharacterized protein LOC110455344 [Mizuhopecten yessoensis]|uniref:uncharacterized protein LOC110455344 n=1 Tax=Mizuhopecten yessoensis TaxID=6573 RepID=UPI000B45896C|nr:uncharacterized protein LOC110455344 [Mizuhopecten yessoensis]XP_021361102.1 uncharacterized protein LOC110455344 [Mizuhopecten yessoensis]
MERRETRKMSRFLSHHLDGIEAIGSEKTVKIRRMMDYFTIIMHGSEETNFTATCIGSRGEGLEFECSDKDVMLSDNRVIVIQPNDEIPEGDVSKTVLVMDTTGCMPGYTLLRQHQVGVLYNGEVMGAMVHFPGSVYLSSVVYISNKLNPGHYQHGPCSTTTCHCRVGHEVDRAYCFHCLSWPDSLSDFRSRTIHCVWPSRQLVNHIVKQGCYFVAIGDKHSSLNAMQWRISFAKAEKSLVMSFNHVHLKTYALLKIFLKECLEREESIKDLLCSYFMKTILFHAIEHSTSSMWVDENIVQCFWFCFTILLEFVQTGYCPNYFVLTHNMFLSNVTGDNRRRLLHVLNKYQCMGWKCLFQCPSLQSLPQEVIESRSMYPLANHEQLVMEEFRQDELIRMLFDHMRIIDIAAAFSSANMDFLKCPNDNISDLLLLYFIKAMTITSSNITADLTLSHRYTNKRVYTKIRKNKWLLHMSSATDVCEGLLLLATFYINAGSYSKASAVATRVVSACQQSALIQRFGHFKNSEYLNDMCGKGYTLLQKFKRSFVLVYRIFKKQNKLYPPELDLEVAADEEGIDIPPLPYAVFLLVLSAYKLGDTKKARTTLDDLLAVRRNEVYGVRNYPILHNLVGICHQLLGNTRHAVKSYEESCRLLPDNRAAASRITELRRHQKEERGDTDVDALDYCNVPCRYERYEPDDDDDDDDDDDRLHYH